MFCSYACFAHILVLFTNNICSPICLQVYKIVTSTHVCKNETTSLGQNKVYPVTSIEHKTDCWKDHEGPLVHLGHDLLQLLPLGVHGLIPQGH